MRKSIYLLLGPKGSGKTLIGSLFNDHFNVPFIRVEDTAKEVKRDRAINDDSYLSEVFSSIENAIRKFINDKSSIVFESTGLTDYFDKMRDSLDQDFNLVKIAVRADADLCLSRVKSRDQSVHINVSDKEVLQINAAQIAKQFDIDFQILNNESSLEELKEQIKDILSK